METRPLHVHNIGGSTGYGVSLLRSLDMQQHWRVTLKDTGCLPETVVMIDVIVLEQTVLSCLFSARKFVNPVPEM